MNEWLRDVIHFYSHANRGIVVQGKILSCISDCKVCWKVWLPILHLANSGFILLALSHLEVVSSDVVRETNKDGNKFQLATSCEVETINKVLVYESVGLVQFLCIDPLKL